MVTDMAARIWLAVSLLASGIVAQTVAPTNSTPTDAAANSGVVLRVSESGQMVNLSSVLPFADSAVTNIPPPGISGPFILANAENQLDISRDNIAIISCDGNAYAGNIGAIDVFSTAEQANASAIVWYSQEGASCQLSGYQGNYDFIYSMKSINDTQRMLDRFQNTNNGYIAIMPPEDAEATNGTSAEGSSNNNQNNQNQNQNPLGPSPSTAVAMIILYSVTGIITALFLVIIITGAIRAHRHPERYGPRVLAGRARQSRARGLARAMLDTIPIVKFGEREPPKPNDVELGDTSASQEARTETREVGSEQTAEATANRERTTEEAAPRTSAAEGGISAATAPTTKDTAAGDPDNQGCSICTEDFQVGEDQRVLPCDHRFHPACIDPWLLNVSGTCPLCRVDLRPQTSRTSEPELDEHGNPIRRASTAEGEDLPPPLDPATGNLDLRRPGVRRSLMLSLLGTSNRMSREERLEALRQYRMQEAVQEARRRAGQQGSSTDLSAAEGSLQPSQQDESGLRSRLRNAFRIRTSRTGQPDAGPAPTAVPETVPEDSEDAQTRQETQR